MAFQVVYIAFKLARYFALLPFFCLGSAEDVTVNSTGSGAYCAFVNNKIATERDTGEPIIIASSVLQTSAEPLSIVRCHSDKEYCYTLFYLDQTNKSRHTILMQGCWDHPDDQECPESDCVARSALSRKNIRNSTRFCCCRGNLCNVNVTDTVNLTAIDIMMEEARFAKGIEANSDVRIIVLSLVGGIVVVSVLVVAAIVRICLVRRRLKKRDEQGNESDSFLASGSDSASRLSTCSAELDGLKFDALISHGRYGDVYRGLLGSSEVAVKVLNTTQYRCYANERDILSMPTVRHASIVEFRGCKEERLPGGSLRYLIVTSYESMGSLTDYLKHNTVDWSTACRMCHSVAAGLAHLHTESNDGGLSKPSIVHRDVNSRNVLVRSDLTCCLCDLGFAMKIAAPRFNDSGAPSEDHNSLADVGTLRYMAPEVLEGSVNLCDCRMALTQVDVYALGLVFWEIGARCHDLYQGLPTPAYQLPFESFVGLHPSFEDMQVAVSRNKQRPVFPDTWKDTNVAIRALKDTIEECWDHDAEARISSVCAEERTREMASLWEIRHKGLTPTTALKNLEDRALVQHNQTSDVSSFDATTCGDTREVCPVEGSTELVEAVVGKLDCNIALAISGAVAPRKEPRNAQNPTVERNTHWSSSEELAVEGNKLIVKRLSGQRETSTTNVPASSNDSSAASSSNINPPVNRTSSSRPASISRLGPQHRISFVQNPMEANFGAMPLTSSGPKRQNVPGNGRAESSCVQPDRRQSEVVLIDGAIGTTVVRPTSLAVDADELVNGNGNSQIDINSQDIGSINDPETGRSILHFETGQLREGNRVPPAVELTLKTSGERETRLSAVLPHSTEGGMHQQFNDNLAFESSTSPRFDDPVAIRRMW